MRLKLLSCEVLYREMCAAVARSIHQVDVAFVPKGLHNRIADMRPTLQTMIDAAQEGYDAVLLGYGLCGNGLVGLTARTVPVVIPRAHDCITLFLGSKDRYQQYFTGHPGVYFKTTGWIERGGETEALPQLGVAQNFTFAKLAAKYGEDNARFLVEEALKYRLAYHQFTFIRMGVEPDDSFENRTREEAQARGWDFATVEGSMTLIERLVGGQWNDAEFLVVQPGWRVTARYDDGILGAEQA